MKASNAFPTSRPALPFHVQTNRKSKKPTNMSGKGWWNNALSGLESRLDTILAEDGSTGPKPAATDGAAKADGTDKAAAAVDKKLGVEAGG